MTSEFPSMTKKRLRELRELDPAIGVIQSRTKAVSFNWLRESFKRNSDVKDSLNYGTAILGDVDQLDQYLYTYGKMIQSQWECVLANCTATAQAVRIIDYGCGQGIVAAIFCDCLGTAFAPKVKEATLIEPSDVAQLERKRFTATSSLPQRSPA